MSELPASAGQYNFFGYYPSLAAGIVFIVAFSLVLVLHLFLTVKSRVWWTIVTSIGILGEIIGWGGRIGAHSNPFGLSLYLLQNICLGISPIFFSATCYTMLGIQIQRIDPALSYIRPRNYLIIFIIVDIISLAVQGAGGGMSGAAAATLSSPEIGSWIFFGGIVFQLINMVIFTLFALDYFRRVQKSEPAVYAVALTARMKLSIAGMLTASGLIILRNIYRAVEMGTGFDGWIAHHEALFTLDAVPMFFCCVVLAASHPLYTFNKMPQSKTSTHDLEKKPERVVSNDSQTTAF